MLLKILFFYFLAITLFTFISFALDKHYAIKNKWRISEKFLLTCGFIGGALGGLLAMTLVRHKTKTTKFVILMPLFLILHIGAVFAIIYFFHS